MHVKKGKKKILLDLRTPPDFKDLNRTIGLMQVMYGRLSKLKKIDLVFIFFVVEYFP